MGKSSKGTKNKNPALLTADNDDSEQGGKGKGGKSGSGVIPTFNELMIAVSTDEAEIARCAKDALFAQRVSLKSQGHKVKALDSKQERRSRLANQALANEGGGGSNLQEHPLLKDTGGRAFDDIEFPENEAEAAAANDPELKNELKLGYGLSVDAIKYNNENKKKEKLTMAARAAPVAEPRMVYVEKPAPSLPRPRPPGL